MDPVTLGGSAVALVAPYLVEGGTELAKKVGGEAGERIVKLYDTVKAKLTGSGAAKDVADFEQAPADQDNQAALRKELKKALEADPAFREELAQLIGEIREKGGERISQIANVTGDHNVTTQIAGSGNVVR
jgi:putative heme iron utilization protein